MTGASTLSLPPRLDHQGTRILQEALRGFRGKALRLDAGKTTFLGALGLQVLLAAAQQWRSEGHHFAITPCSPAFADDLLRLGAELSDLNEDQL